MKNLRLPLTSIILWAFAQLIVQTPSTAENACPPPALSRLRSHQVAAGETIESIASRYNLIPATLMELNPSFKGGLIPPVGSTILIPPFNGIRVQAPAGANWKDLAEAYGVRADILFEVNGCQQQPLQVFVPGVNWSRQERPIRENYTGFPGYPLPSVASVALGYGWQQNSNLQQSKFHSGLDLLANPGTSVLSVEAGTVAFAGEQGSYGNLVVVNHQGGRQTRYAHLGSTSVGVGQRVQMGNILGTVGSTGSPDVEKSHLHFEVRQDSPLGWVAQDPKLHLQARQGSVGRREEVETRGGGDAGTRR